MDWRKGHASAKEGWRVTARLRLGGLWELSAMAALVSVSSGWICGWRVVAIDAFPSGLVTATPPTPLFRRGGGGARTCATQRSIRRVERKGKGVGFVECAYGGEGKPPPPIVPPPPPPSHAHAEKKEE
eukprot:scaffold3795_cov126-Isochrysis_galbana.AAC.5